MNYSFFKMPDITEENKNTRFINYSKCIDILDFMCKSEHNSDNEEEKIIIRKYGRLLLKQLN